MKQIEAPVRVVAKFPQTDDPAGAAAVAALVVHPAANAAVVIEQFGKIFGTQDTGALMAAVQDGAARLETGDLGGIEAMLISQAHALQAVFTNLAHRSLLQDRHSHTESFLRLALKAQGQCRQTLESLAAVKNPPVVFARQANFAAGLQQVNNGTAAPASPSRAAEIQPVQNEVLERQPHGQWLDTGAAGAPVAAHSPLEAVGAGQRAGHA